MPIIYVTRLGRQFFHSLSPKLLVQAYRTLIQPILLYGSDVWGFSRNMCESIDKVCLFFLRCILRVKSSTSNLMCFGELGIIPPSILAKINLLNFHLRLKDMSLNSLEKAVIDDMYELKEVGFSNIISSINDIATLYDIDLSCCSSSIESVNVLKSIVKSDYINGWYNDMLNNNSSLRSYKLFKKNFDIEPYLLYIKNDRYRQALSKFRCSSHFLEIERARHQSVIPPIWERTCPFCPNAVDDELHLLLYCTKNSEIRNEFLDCVYNVRPEIRSMHHTEKLISIMGSTDHVILKALGKFIFYSFELRKRI